MKKDIIILCGLWLMLWLWWGDVLWTTAENSYYGGGGAQMHFLWSQSYGSLWIMGRLLLTTCHLPWLGALLLATMLTVCAALLRYTLRLRHSLEYLPVLAYLLWMVHQGFNLYYQHEPGRLHGIAFMTLALLGVESFFLWTFRRRKPHAEQAHVKGKTKKWSVLHISPDGFCAMLLLIAVPMLYGQWLRPYVRPVCHMQRAMEQGDWQEMMKTAQANTSYVTRPMAAYHAIALVRQDKVLNHLFDLPYIFRDISLYNRADMPDKGYNYFTADCNMHAGLLQTCYHNAMEELTMQGPSMHTLKRLCQVAVMRGESKVAEKYLTLLEREPFSDNFVKTWQALNRDSVLREAYPLVQSIRRLEPIHDSFEKDYAQPTFLGYNVALQEGRSPQALENSIAVCLYTKLIPAFMERVRYMSPERLNTKTVALEALAMQAIRDQSIAQAVPILQGYMARYRSMLAEMKNAGITGSTDERKPFANEMLEKWPAYYPAYYFFGNLDATVQGAAQRYGYESAGVN